MYKTYKRDIDFVNSCMSVYHECRLAGENPDPRRIVTLAIRRGAPSFYLSYTYLASCDALRRRNIRKTAAPVLQQNLAGRRMADIAGRILELLDSKKEKSIGRALQSVLEGPAPRYYLSTSTGLKIFGRFTTHNSSISLLK